MNDRLTIADLDLERLLPGDAFGEHWLATNRREGGWIRFRRVDEAGNPRILGLRFDVDLGASLEVVHAAAGVPLGWGRGGGGCWTATRTSTGQVLRCRRYMAHEAVHLVGQVVEGLEALHGAGLVHGAVRPAAVQLEGDRVVLGDLGLGALFLDHVHRTRKSDALSCVAPEQLQGAWPTPRTDVFAAGALLFLLYTGRPAFPGWDLQSIRRRQQEEDPPLLHHPVGAVVRRCLARDPAARYPAAGALRAALQLALERTPAPPPRWSGPPLINIPRRRAYGAT